MAGVVVTTYTKVTGGPYDSYVLPQGTTWSRQPVGSMAIQGDPDNMPVLCGVSDVTPYLSDPNSFVLDDTTDDPSVTMSQSAKGVWATKFGANFSDPSFDNISIADAWFQQVTQWSSSNGSAASPYIGQPVSEIQFGPYVYNPTWSYWDGSNTPYTRRLIETFRGEVQRAYDAEGADQARKLCITMSLGVAKVLIDPSLGYTKGNGKPILPGFLHLAPPGRVRNAIQKSTAFPETTISVDFTGLAAGDGWATTPWRDPAPSGGGGTFALASVGQVELSPVADDVQENGLRGETPGFLVVNDTPLSSSDQLVQTEMLYGPSPGPYTIAVLRADLTSSPPTFYAVRHDVSGNGELSIERVQFGFGTQIAVSSNNFFTSNGYTNADQFLPYGKARIWSSINGSSISVVDVNTGASLSGSDATLASGLHAGWQTESTNQQYIGSILIQDDRATNVYNLATEAVAVGNIPSVHAQSLLIEAVSIPLIATAAPSINPGVITMWSYDQMG